MAIPSGLFPTNKKISEDVKLSGKPLHEDRERYISLSCQKKDNIGPDLVWTYNHADLLLREYSSK